MLILIYLFQNFTIYKILSNKNFSTEVFDYKNNHLLLTIKKLSKQRKKRIEIK